MRRALIGFGTPLGSYLAQCLEFSDTYTYKQALTSIERCDEAIMVCPAGKLLGGSCLAPQGFELAAKLKQAAGRIVVLSSIEVYPAKGVPFDEYSLPFGLHRKAWLEVFEQEVLSRRPETIILRLPEVLGLPGTRPGFNSDPSKINRVAIHQWYPVRRLPRDIDLAQTARVTIANLVTEPLPMAAILKQFFPGHIGRVTTPAPYSRIKTRFAAPFGGNGSYIMDAPAVLEEFGSVLRACGRTEPAYTKVLATAASGMPVFAAVC